MNDKKVLMATGLIVGLSLIIAATIFGLFFYQSRGVKDTIKVVGISSERYDTDIIKWEISLTEYAKLDNAKQGYEGLKASLDNLRDLIKEEGIKVEDMNVKPATQYKKYNRDGKVVGYNIKQNVYIISKEVDKIESLALNQIELADKGISIQRSNLKYFYSGIDELKKDILSAATVNAQERAEKILANTDLKPGKMLSVRAGVFQITEPYSTNVSSSGIYNTSSKKKEIKVTVHVTFSLK